MTDTNEVANPRTAVQVGNALIAKVGYNSARLARKVLGHEPDPVIELLAKGLENSHRAIWKISRGRLGQRAFGMQSLELHTIGRKSGRRHSTILTAPICAPDRLVVVASKGGSSSHPDWYKNLAVNPLVEITIEGQTYPYATRTATSQEKSQLWPLIIRAFPGYQGYQQNTARDIPLVICVPN